MQTGVSLLNFPEIPHCISVVPFKSCPSLQKYLIISPVTYGPISGSLTPLAISSGSSQSLASDIERIYFQILSKI